MGGGGEKRGGEKDRPFPCIPTPLVCTLTPLDPSASGGGKHYSQQSGSTAGDGGGGGEERGGGGSDL